MKYIYERSGGPLIQWSGRNSAPMQTRAPVDSLGSLGDTTLSRPTLAEPTLVLPKPGAPEPLNGDCGCGCKGAGTCGGGAMHGITDTVTAHPVLAALGAYLAYKWLKKRKR